MSQPENNCCGMGRTPIYVIAILATLLIGYGLIRKIDSEARPKAITANKTEERYKNLRELRAATTDAQEHYGFVDQPRGVTRLPISKAMEMRLQMAADPVAARSNLIARVERATAAAPKVPEKPSQFE